MAITQAIRRDVDRKIIDSHRLMPLSPAGAMLGYLIGPSITGLKFAGVNFLVGMLGARRNRRGMFRGGSLATWRLRAWRCCCGRSWRAPVSWGKNLGILSVVGLAVAGPAAPAIYSFVVPIKVLAAPLMASLFDPHPSVVMERWCRWVSVVQGVCLR